MPSWTGGCIVFGWAFLAILALSQQPYYTSFKEAPSRGAHPFAFHPFFGYNTERGGLPL